MRAQSVARPPWSNLGWLRGLGRERAGNASGGRLSWSWPFADRWGREGRHKAVRLWADAQGAPQLALAVRVKAATACDPFLR